MTIFAGRKRAKFADSQRSPVFVQFIDAVFQLTVQFPTQFEYNPLFLADLFDFVLSCRFGTFLCDSERMRVKTKLVRHRLRLPSNAAA